MTNIKECDEKNQISRLIKKTNKNINSKSILEWHKMEITKEKKKQKQTSVFDRDDFLTVKCK